jgi:hypothetical protein
VSETPRTDAAYSIYDLRKVAQDIERELAEANKTNRLQYELITTAEKRGVDKSKEELAEANERIKRLEEAGDAAILKLVMGVEHDALEIWNKAKEAKP